jgi:hypothetical protein
MGGRFGRRGNKARSREGFDEEADAAAPSHTIRLEEEVPTENMRANRTNHRWETEVRAADTVDKEPMTCT